MRLIKFLIEKINFRSLDINENKPSIETCLHQLYHDVNNNLIAIKSSVGNIRSILNITEEKPSIEKSLNDITQMAGYAMIHLELSDILSSPPEKYSSIVSNFSALHCVNEAINFYPYTSFKQKEFIKILTPVEDFFIDSSEKIIKNIFYCIIKNGLQAIYNKGDGNIFILFEKLNRKNYIYFKYPKVGNVLLCEQLFSLGLPEKKSYGFYFIEKIMNCIGGKIIFEDESEKLVSVKLLF
jgi:hypothetical protein